MEDAATVRETDRLTDLLEHLNETRHVVPTRRLASSARQQFRQRLAADQLHRQPRRAIIEGAQGMHGWDAGVRQLRGDFRFSDEALGVRPG
jgi:hypothetical protein